MIALKMMIKVTLKKLLWLNFNIKKKVNLKKKTKIQGLNFLNVQFLQEMFLGEYEALKSKFNESRGQYAIYLAKLGRL